jgi:hypothetical protein
VLDGSAAWHEWLPSGDLWPGGVAVVLAVAGAWIGRRLRGVRFLVGLGAAAVLVSLGSRLRVAGWRPWPWLADHVDAVGRLRSPFRAAVVVDLAVAALAAPALQWLWRRPSTRLVGPTAVVAAGLLGWTGPGPLRPVPDTHGFAWVSWLADHRDGGAVAVLPAAPGPSEADFEPTTVAMLAGLDSGHPLANGYSGFFPPGQAAFRDAVARFPDQRSFDALTGRGVHYVVADPEWLGGARVGAAAAGLRILVDDDDGVLLVMP